MSPSSVSTTTDDRTAPSTDQLRTTLSTVLPLLDAFNHRHRNQHRSSPWWSTFGIFRRSLKRLASSSRGKDCGEVDRFGFDKITSKAVWFINIILPKAYIAFSQLTADNQHAPLGLLLLGVLSQMYASLRCYLPQDQPPAHQDNMLPTSQRDKTSSYSANLVPGNIERGVAVSRQTIIVAKKSPAPVSREGTCIEIKSGVGSLCQREGQPKKEKKKRKNKDVFSSLFNSLG